ncbi:14065_t:CDS:2 [Entrophospora sp. SA101]|nr:14065_t:CDS:2 [Entrophospora sp. SA101]CAJ0830308.1 1818_t:CDS:2 [Entrophospora sp. SA101]
MVEKGTPLNADNLADLFQKINEEFVSFQLYQEVKNNYIVNLLQFLKAGGHKDPLAILRDIGIDLNKTDVYQPLLDNLQGMIEELKKLTGK